MFHRVLALTGIVLALFGMIVAPGIVTREARRRILALHSIHPDEGDVPWDLTGWIPVGFLDRTAFIPRPEWRWMPRFRRVK
jgi:hypothetical protein